MSREIIFRGKRVDNGGWVEGFYTQLPVGSIGATIFANDDEIVCEDVSDYIIAIKAKQHSNYSNGNPLQVMEMEQYEVDPSTVCQYTGYKDQKGNRIFEGDIVGFEDRTSAECGYLDYWCVGLVEWCNNVAGYNVTNRLSAKSREILQDCVVLGNKWDNSDLLEGRTGEE